RAIALQVCLPHDGRMSFAASLHNRVVGECVRSLTPLGSLFAEPSRAWFMKKQGVRSSHAASAVIAEYTANSLASAILTVGAAIYFLYYFRAAHLRVPALVLLYGAAGYLVLALLFLVY